MTKLNTRIADLIKQHGSLRKAAAVTGVHYSLLSRLQSGKRLPTDDVARRLGLKKKVVYSEA